MLKKDIHEEVHRLILRSRWLRWYLRYPNDGPPKKTEKKLMRLSQRLSRWKPCWEERPEREDEGFDCDQ